MYTSSLYHLTVAWNVKCIYHILFHYGHLDCLQLPSIINNFAVILLILISLWIYMRISLGYIPKAAMSGCVYIQCTYT